jgi:hypothetical protein
MSAEPDHPMRASHCHRQWNVTLPVIAEFWIHSALPSSSDDSRSGTWRNKSSIAGRLVPSERWIGDGFAPLAENGQTPIPDDIACNHRSLSKELDQDLDADNAAPGES